MNMCFVFGSNLRGLHGAGSARYAHQREGAVYGQGIGHYGNSYAIPTKDWCIRTLPLRQIQDQVDDFIQYAKEHPELKFKVTRIGCGLAGYEDKDIAPMFYDAPDNCYFDEEWKPIFMAVGQVFKYWGSHG